MGLGFFNEISATTNQIMEFVPFKDGIVTHTCKTQITEWAFYNTVVICSAIVISILIIAVMLCMWHKATCNRNIELKKQEYVHEEIREKREMDQAQQLHDNKISDLTLQEERDRRALEEEYSKIQTLLSETLRHHQAGLKVTVTIKQGSNTVTITSPDK